MTHPRIVARGATYAIVRRCVLRKAFLGWWSTEVDDVFLWCLALAAKKNGVEIHHAVRVGSHYHLTITVTRQNLGAFLRDMNRELSCALNTLLAKHGYDAPRELFESRQTHVMRLMDADVQLAHLVYERLNVVVAGLAATCDGIPGRTLAPGLWKTGGVRLTRPSVYFASGPDTLHLRLTPPPLLALAFGGNLDAMLHHIGVLERAGENAIATARGGRPVRTPAEVRGIHPWAEPPTLRERGGERVACFKATGWLANVAGAVEVKRWRGAYREASRRWCDGDRDVVFPVGTYEMRRFHGAKVAEAGEDAWVSAPGPTSEDVQAMLAAGAERDGSIVDRARELVVDGVTTAAREAMAAEDEATGTGNADSDGVDEEREARPAGVTVHRFSKLRPMDPEKHPRRLTTLRDRRRGRGRGDPPED